VAAEHLPDLDRPEALEDFVQVLDKFTHADASCWKPHFGLSRTFFYS
jgi:hypothetical protein